MNFRITNIKQAGLFIVTAVCAVAGIMSCGGAQTYANMLNAQKASIATYISDNKIEVVNTLPTGAVWNPNTYFLSSSGLYFHLINAGDNSDPSDTIRMGKSVTIRYIKIDIGGGVIDTVDNAWTTLQAQYPITMTYGVTDGTYPVAWQEAIKYMRFSNSEAQIIVPAALGTSTDQTKMTPYVYRLHVLRLP